MSIKDPNEITVYKSKAFSYKPKFNSYKPKFNSYKLNLSKLKYDKKYDTTTFNKSLRKSLQKSWPTIEDAPEKLPLNDQGDFILFQLKDEIVLETASLASLIEVAEQQLVYYKYL
jgi:hypothetical protein